MSPAEHQEQAEKMLAEADRSEWGSQEEKYNLAAAQVHATLALAGHFEQLRAGAR